MGVLLGLFARTQNGFAIGAGQISAIGEKQGDAVKEHTGGIVFRGCEIGINILDALPLLGGIDQIWNRALTCLNLNRKS